MCTFIVPVLVVIFREFAWWPCKYFTTRVDHMPAPSSFAWISPVLQEMYAKFLKRSNWILTPTELAVDDCSNDCESGIPMNNISEDRLE